MQAARAVASTHGAVVAIVEHDGNHAQIEASSPAPLAQNGSAREPSYPAPPMPLTEQERLLLQIAHRNDPVQVAMLDPVERGLTQARERAATTRFFTPAPLPAELQQQVNAALRSQYVNTPPPSELLAQTSDRSQP